MFFSSLQNAKDCFTKALKEVYDLKMFPSCERFMKEEKTLAEQVGYFFSQKFIVNLYYIYMLIFLFSFVVSPVHSWHY
jgi:hypothetical protein